MKTSLDQSKNLLAALVLLAGLAVPVAQAANWAWDTAPGSANFSGPNWTSGTTPGSGASTPASGDSLYFGASGTTTLNCDQGSFTYGGLTFNPGASAFAIGGNAFTLNGAVNINSANAQVINNNIALNATESVNLTGGSLTLGGVVSGAGFGLSLSGTNTLTLTNLNTYTGPTEFGVGTFNNKGGNLTLNYAAGNNIINPASSLSFWANGNAGYAQASTITFNGAAGTASSQAFAGIGGGAYPGMAHLNLVPGSGGGTMTVQLGVQNRSNGTGAGMEVIEPAGGGATLNTVMVNNNSICAVPATFSTNGVNQANTWAVSGATQVGSSGNASTSASGNTVSLSSGTTPTAGQQIEFSAIPTGSGLTVNQVYYVVNPSGSTFQVANYRGGTALALTTSTANGTLVVEGAMSGLASGSYTTSYSSTANKHLDVGTGGTLNGNPYTLRFNNANAATVTITAATVQDIQNGSILVTPAVGNSLSLITGGILQGISRRDLQVFQNNTATNLEIDSEIADLGGAACPLAKFGPGTLLLTANNTFSGFCGVAEGVAIGTGSAAASFTATATSTANNNVISMSSTAGIFIGQQVTAPASTWTGNNTWIVTAISPNTSVTVTPNSGITAVSGGTFTFGGTGAFGTGNLSTAPGATAQLGNGGSSGSLYSGQSVVDNGTFIFNRLDAGLNFANVISGSGNVVNNGSGTVTLSGANTYTGGTIVNSGTLMLSGSGTLGGAANALTVNGGILDLGGLTSPTAGAVTISGGTIQDGKLTASTSYTANNSGAATVSAVLAGSSIPLTMSGFGTLTLSGANTFTGGVNLNGGTANAGIAQNGTTSGPFGASGTISFGGGTLQYSAVNQYDYSSRFSTAANQPVIIDLNGTNVTFATGLTGSGGTLTVSSSTGTGTLTLTGTSTYTGNTTVGSGALLTIGSAGKLGGGNYAGNLTNNGAFTYISSAAQTLGGVISGSGAVTNSGSGTLTLTGNNTFTNPIVITGGTVSVAAIGNSGVAGPLGAALAGVYSNAPIQMFNNSLKTLQYTGPGETNNRSIYINQQITANQYATLDASGTGPLVFNNATNIVMAIVNASIGDSPLTLTGSNTGDNTLAGDIQDGLSKYLAVVKQGAGTWALTGPKNFHGRVDVAGGTLKFDSLANAGTACALGQATELYISITASGYAISLTNGGVLQYIGTGASTSDRIIGLTGSGTLSAGTNGGTLTLTGGITNLNASATTLTLDGTSANTISGPIADSFGSLAITKVGTGTWTLAGTDNYGGATTVNAGTLLVAGSTAAGSAITVNNLATLGGSGTIGGNVTFAPGALATNNQGSPLTISGSLTLNNNTLNVSTTSALGAGSYTLMTYNPTGSTGSFNGTPVISGANLAAGATGTIVTSAGSVTLHVVAATTLGLTSSVSPSTYGQSVTFTAAVRTNSVTAGAATGNVIFSVGGTPVVTNAVAGGQATYSTSVLTVPSHTITAAYSGDANYLSSNNSLMQTVHTTALTITANNTNKVYDRLPFAGGNGVTYAGFVNGETNTVLTGTLTYGGTSQGATNVGGYTIVPSGQTGTNYSIIIANGTLTISQANTFVGASSSENPSGYKDSISFTATLPSDATGSVVFSSTNGPISTNSVSGGSATSLSITTLPRGTNVITVAYLGDVNYFGSTSNLNQIVTNHPPVAAVMTVTRMAGLRLLIPLFNLSTNWSDVDGDTVELTTVNMQSTNGVNLKALNWITNLDNSIATTNANAFIGYTNSPNVNDQISYAISDGQGGTNVGYINIVIQSSVTGTNSITDIAIGTGSNTVNAYGLPGFTYILERATNLAPAVWIDVATNPAATNGVINAVDTFWDLRGVPPASAFYQLKWQP